MLSTSSMHRNFFFANPMNLNGPIFQGPAFAQTSAPTLLASSEKPEVDNQVANESTEQDNEVDFFASLLMDFSKGVYNPSLAQDTFAKRKSDEIDSSSFMTKKNKRMPRSPSINTLVAEQTIACEEHSSKHLRCPMNCPNRRPGSKRMRSVPTDENRSSAVSELETEEPEQVTATIQKKEPIQLVYQPSSKYYELPKPVEVDDFVQILKWAFLQLPSLQGNFEEIFSVIRKNGWKELRNGTPREILLCKKNFLKHLENTFQLKGVDGNGEHIYFSKEFSPELSENENKSSKKTTQKRRGRPSAIEPQSPTSDFTLSSPINSAPGSPVSSLNNSEQPAFPFIGEEYYEEDDSNLEPGSASYLEKQRKKGRRWLRFACEKHRKEHTKCGENCPSRRITYTVRGNAPAVESQ